MAEGFQAAGKIIGGIGAYEAGRFNQKMSRVEAIEIERAGVEEEARVRDAARMAMGDQVAAQAGSGFAIGAGSALDALEQSQVNAALDALTIRRETAGQARARRIQGDIAKAEGDNALVQGMLGAGASVQSMRTDWAAARRGDSRGRG